MPSCAGLFHNEDVAVRIISLKMHFWATELRVSTPTMLELSKLTQATEEISKQTRSDRPWSQLIFSDTWHWDPLTSTQRIPHTANGGEQRAKTRSKEAHSATMIRHRLDIWEPDYSGNELGNVANDYINKRALRCPFSLWSCL